MTSRDNPDSIQAQPPKEATAIALVDIASLISYSTENANTQALNPAAVYLDGLGQSSRRVMKTSLNLCADTLLQIAGVDLAVYAAHGQELCLWFPWHKLGRTETSRLRSALQNRNSQTTGKPLSPSTINRAITAIRGVLKEAWELGLMSAEAYQRAAGIKVVRGSREASGRYIPQTERKALMATCSGNSPKDIRDAAILVFLQMGLRRAEVANRFYSDYNPSDHTIRVTGKGNKERLVPIPRAGQPYLDTWLTTRGTASGPLFSRVSKNGKIAGDTPLTPQAILYIVETRLHIAGLPTLSPHDFRRTYISDMLDAGVDIVTIQKAVGHAETKTTARYDRRGFRAVQKAMDQVII